MLVCDSRYKRVNEKGFTLIELLAVIVILGILMIVTIPAVTKYINNSKKDTFADSAGAYINSARYSLLNDEYSTCSLPSDSGQCVYITIDNIDVDKGGGKSSYGRDFESSSYVVVKFDRNGKLSYSIDLVDTQGNGTTGLTNEQDLDRNKIKTKQSSRNPTPTTKPEGCTALYTECKKPTS